jgi:two-component system nitrogen regulation response regulator GlnG
MLRDRREDIPQLAKHFLRAAANELNVEPKILRPETEKYLTGLNWPGNVRQLENFCRWITVMASSREVHLNDLPPEFSDQQTKRSDTGSWTQSLEAWADQELSLGNKAILEQAVPLFERTMIDVALKHSAGRRRDAANLLGWGRNTLTRKIKELGTAENEESAKPDSP